MSTLLIVISVWIALGVGACVVLMIVCELHDWWVEAHQPDDLDTWARDTLADIRHLPTARR